MDLCINNLEDYIKSRENDITINEIKEVLNQLNNKIPIIKKNKPNNIKNLNFIDINLTYINL